MHPAKINSMLQAAIVHHRAGRLSEAEAAYRPLRTAAPKNFDVLHLSGLLAYQQERISDAIDLLRRALRISPRDATCEMRLALALLGSGVAVEAEKHLRHALQLDPKFSEAWDNLAYLLKTQDRLVEALVCHEKAVTLNPAHAVAWYNYGLTLSFLGRYSEALQSHERGMAADPEYSLARFGRAQALHQGDRIREAVAEYREFVRRQPEHLEARSYLLFALHTLEGVTREELFAEHLAYGRAVGDAPRHDWRNSRQPRRLLRIAILSPDLRTHSCAYFLEPLLRHLNREEFELYLYHDYFREDAISGRMRALAKVWRNFIGLPGPVLEKAIRLDEPDILIDLAGHTGMTNRLPLFARRLAPVQVTYLGYPNTTGVPAMDYRFTDAWADPEGEADHFATEKLIRFSSTAWAYSPPEDAPEPIRLSGPGEAFTFGCFNAPKKISDGVLALWARLMSAIPDSRLLLKGAGFGEPTVRTAYFERLVRLGLVVDRVGLVERMPDTRSHLAMYQRVDVALDTFPYHGTTTTCEALWMGVPVVVFAGDQHMSRVGVSLLHAAGHPEWIAHSAEDYLRIAVQLAADIETRRRLRSELRDDLRRGPLMDHKGQAERFGAALRNCWINWCATSPTPVR